MDLTLVLACYNEAPWLEASIREIVETLELGRLSYEILLVDDASHDGTPELIRSLEAAGPPGRVRGIFHPVNTGRGQAVADGLRAATGEIVGFIDVDLEVHPRYIASCCQAIRRGAAVAVGARVFKLVPLGLWRHVLSAGYARLARWLLPLGDLTDTESGCKFFRREAILPLLPTIQDRGWFWDTEVMVRCRLAGLPIVEVPCLYVRNPGKPSTARVMRDAAATLVKIFAFRRRLRREGRRATRPAVS